MREDQAGDASTPTTDAAGIRPRPRLRLEVAANSPEHAQAFLDEIRRDMLRLNVYRGHVISLSPGQMGMGPQSLVAFHTLPKVDRQDVVLPDGLLERIERHTAGFAEHAERAAEEMSLAGQLGMRLMGFQSGGEAGAAPPPRPGSGYPAFFRS